MPISDREFETKVTLETHRTGVLEEPPFHIMVMGGFSGDANRGPVAERKLVEIDRDNFDATIARLGVRLNLEMGGDRLPLEFADLDDFHPDQIFRRIHIFAELRDLRKRLNDESTFNAAAREVRERFDNGNPDENPVADDDVTQSPVEAEAMPENLLDAILAKPSGGSTAPKAGVSSDIANLVSDLVRPLLVSVDENEQAQMLAAVDAATSGLMRGILRDPRFMELEAAWRGLFFLVRRTETSGELKIHLCDVSKAELADNLKSANSLAETVVYRHLIRDAVEMPGGEPFAVVLGNYAFAGNVDDIATLMRLGKLVSAANAPFISHIRPDIIGVRSLAENPEPSAWKTSDETEATKLWSTLRGQPEAEYLGMVTPRFLARLPYGADTDPLDTFAFEEFAEGADHDDYIWTNGCFAAGQLLAESFAARGWEMGRELKQDIEGLPVHVYKLDGQTIYKPCSEVLLTDAAVYKLMDLGFMPLMTYKNSDRVKLARFQSIADTELKGMWTSSS